MLWVYWGEWGYGGEGKPSYAESQGDIGGARPLKAWKTLGICKNIEMKRYKIALNKKTLVKKMSPSSIKSKHLQKGSI